jgi:hypothetical protein
MDIPCVSNVHFYRARFLPQSHCRQTKAVMPGLLRSQDKHWISAWSKNRFDFGKRICNLDLIVRSMRVQRPFGEFIHFAWVPVLRDGEWGAHLRIGFGSGKSLG